MPTDVEESAYIVVILHGLFTSGEIKALLKDIKEIKQSLIGEPKKQMFLLGRNI